MSVSKTRRNLMLGTAMAGAIALTLMAGATSAQERAVAYDLKEQSLRSALLSYGRISKTPIILSDDLVRGLKAPQLKGSYSPSEALDRLLAGSGLAAERTPNGAAMIVRGNQGPQDGAAADPAIDEKTVLDEIVVTTGSHIVGSQPTSPVNIISRKDIDRSGYSQVGDVVRSLPQNFSGGQNPGVQFGATAGGATNQNLTNASSVNLRGLGTDATLVLLNGHRLAADGLYQGVDISGIPLAALERIEVVTDGASALYGSDAVAGVANFILRKDYDGAEFSARVGGATQGGGFEQTYGGLAGKSWDEGYILGNFEYSEQKEISVSQRNFTAGAPEKNTLLQPIVRKSAFLSLAREVNNFTYVRIDSLYSKRWGDYFSQTTAASIGVDSTIDVESFAIAPSIEFRLPFEWSASIDGSLSRSKDVRISAYSNGIGGSNDFFRNRVKSVELNAGGPLITLPTGELKFAAGGGVRNESFRYDTLTTTRGAGRTVSYYYAEINAPLIRPSSARIGLNELDLNIAGRVEEYSDFGSTSNPKVGLRYVPADGLAIRGTWGKSFKAPTFGQLTQSHIVYLYRAAQLGGPATGTVLYSYGGSKALKPEKSTSWTLGFDWSPASIPKAKVSLTYFDIDYRDRVVFPISAFGRALSDPSFAPFITASPSPTAQATSISGAQRFSNLSGLSYNPSQVIAYIDGQLVNAAAQNIKGLDFSISKSFDLNVSDLEIFGSASWLNIDQKTIPTVPATTLTGTLYYPPSTKMRSGATWTASQISATAIINYIAGEVDTNIATRPHISSWTTLDLNLAYRFKASSGPAVGLEVALAISNALDKVPPYAQGAGLSLPGIYFDSTNTSPIGRFVALSARKRF